MQHRTRQPKFAIRAMSVALAAWATSMLQGCSTPPLQPPAADESRKRPANTAALVELQVCHSDLQNTRILAAERARDAAAQGDEVVRLVRQQQALVEHVDAVRAAAAEAAVAQTTELRNTLVTLTFPFAGTRLDLPRTQAEQLAAAARSAPLILLRGRTDGDTESPAEGRVARARAQAARDWLVQAGVPPARIRTTWQPVGDHVVDNTLPEGRALNRRVEIELYHAAPRVADLGAGTTP